MAPLIDPAGTRLLDAFRADVLHGAPLPCTAIHPDDYMLRFFLLQHHGHWEGALVDYFSTGLSASRTLDRLLSWWFGAARREVKVLDFASGFGRVTRYLVQHLAPRRLWVADIFPTAVEFQQRCFGVHGFSSSAEPEQLECSETFDCVVATSLFSHLPEETFEPWLRRLVALLRPGGLLLLSVHDHSLRPIMGREPRGGPGTQSAVAGIEFEPASEIPELAAESYGTTWVDEAFVRRAVAAAAGGARCVRLPRALSSFQDIYAVGLDNEREPPPHVGDPVGHLEGAARSPDGRWITLNGWAHDLHGAGAVTLEVRVDGELVARCPVELSRPDVAAVFGTTDLNASWALSVGSPAGRLAAETMLSLTAVSARGGQFLLHLGSIEGTELGLRLRQEAAARELAERNAAAALAAESLAESKAAAALAAESRLSSEIGSMRASRFWKLHDVWWGLRRMFGMGHPP